MRRFDPDLQHFARRQASVAARLQRVNRALAAWDVWEAAQALPADQQPMVRRPGPLGRRAFESLQRVLVDILGELDRVWEWRN